MSIVQPLQDDTNDPFNITGYGLNLDGYESALLRLALSYDNQSTQVSRYPTWLPRGREFSMMNDGVAIDVVWGSATKDRFESYSAVKIPIYKGLIGWRMALVKTSRLEQFAAVKSISDLRQFIPGQHRNWSDYKIFSANQLDITSGANRGALAQMLVLDRIDYFPRAVIEMNKELRDFAHLDIAFEPYILIRYKSAYVFYVAKSNTFLKHIIEKGLHQAQNDGSFDALFKQHFGAELASFSLDKRRVIELHNPLLPEEMLEIEESMWISPKAFK
ncbi:MAG: transporter substrate-binding domain-containing protein [Aliiglaciecola sp.]